MEAVQMSKYLLVAVRHELKPLPLSDHGQVMSVACATRFIAEVAPLITDQSLVLSEGLNFASVLSPAHREYEYEKSWIFNGLLDTASPTLGGCDFRQRDWNKVNANYTQWMAMVRRLSVHIPGGVFNAQSVLQMIEAIRSKTEGVAVELTAQPSKDEIEVAKWMDITNRKFDRVYLEAMQKRGRRHDLCVFVGGASHVISMALKSGYPVVDLTTAAADAAESWQILTGHLGDYVWPKLYLPKA